MRETGSGFMSRASPLEYVAPLRIYLPRLTRSRPHVCAYYRIFWQKVSRETPGGPGLRWGGPGWVDSNCSVSGGTVDDLDGEGSCQMSHRSVSRRTGEFAARSLANMWHDGGNGRIVRLAGWGQMRKCRETPACLGDSLVLMA
jgi:hypothetical protein